MTVKEIKRKLGLDALPSLLFLALGLAWALLFLVLLVGLFWIIVEMPRSVASADEDSGALVLRYSLLALAALTATLGAVVTLPLTLIRTRFSARQTHATEQDLITDRINKAVEMLGTEKVVKIPGKSGDGGDIEIEATVPNMEVRTGAIHALARLARENLNFHVQIMEILCAYIRENSPVDSAEPLHMPEMPTVSNTNPPEAWRKWIIGYRNDEGERTGGLNQALSELKSSIKTRTDIQTALTVLGHRTEAQRKREAGWPEPGEDGEFIFDHPFTEATPYPEKYTLNAHAEWSENLGAFKATTDARRAAYRSFKGYRLDLRRCNLQNYDMQGLNLRGARFDTTVLQVADLRDAQLQGADLASVQMQGADLSGVGLQVTSFNRGQLQGADLRNVQLQGANLSKVELQGANLAKARLQAAVLTFAGMQGVDFREAELQGANLEFAQMQAASLWLAHAYEANFFEAMMHHVNLNGARLQGANFRDAQLARSGLSQSLLQGAILIDARLQQANLEGAQLQRTILERAQLNRAYLKEARFSESTDLSAAQFNGCALCMVDVSRVQIKQEQIAASFGDGTIQNNDLPRGVTRPAHWPDGALSHYLDYSFMASPFHLEWQRWLADPDAYTPPPPGTYD